jgi:uncharacterized protein YjbI with pentapeptide repeats
MLNKRKRSGKVLKAPDLPLQLLEKTSPDHRIEEGTLCTQSLFTRNDWSGQNLRHLSFDQVLLEHVEMNKTHFEYIRILDSRFKACDLANAEWIKADFARVELLDCHLTGFQANEAHFQDTLFKECMGHFAQCALAKFEAVRFENCDLSDANFFEADLSGALFINCDLSNADFSGAKLYGADLRGSKIDGIRVGPRELQGAILDSTQALAFVRGLGITVKAPEGTL